MRQRVNNLLAFPVRHEGIGKMLQGAAATLREMPARRSDARIAGFQNLHDAGAIFIAMTEFYLKHGHRAPQRARNISGHQLRPRHRQNGPSRDDGSFNGEFG